MCQADLQDISSQDFPLPLKISQIVSPKEIKDAIRKLPTGKATGPDRIPNKAIKAASEAIATPLADAATTYLLKSKIPECCKETITVVLRKANKKDYSLLGSYRPVALKNTLGKILEKIVAERIQEAIEAQRLLLWT